MKTLLTTILFTLLTLSGISANAAPPTTVTYQGYLTASSGAPVTTPVAMTMTLYTAPSGGTALWSEHQASVSVVNGVYSVLLGSVTPLGLPFDTVYYLGVAVGSDPEMTPRQELSSVPYTFRAMSADRLNQACADGEVLMYAAASSSWSCAIAAGPQGPAGPPGSTGLTGATGLQGVAGVAGPTGITGAAGPQGSTGLTGATGPQGVAGIQGPQGVASVNGQVMVAGNAALNGTTDPTGGIGVNGDFYVNITTNMLFGPKAGGAWPAGSVSIIGPTGQTGMQGIQGPQGIAGAYGINGATGPQGSQGVAGPTGPQGITGNNGQILIAGNAALSGTADPTAGVGINGDFYVNTTSNMVFGPKAGGAWPAGSISIIGPQGLPGAQGNAGVAGATGPAGAQGLTGSTGATGPQGPQGLKGDTGATGSQGVAGVTGPAGAVGATGAAGVAGPQGTVGPQGPIGPTGSTGALGPIGPQGTAGQTIIAGQAVLNGATDPAAATGIDGEFYINTSTNVLWGPKTAGAWPVSGVSMIGPAGTAGTTGPQGPVGAQGQAGTQGLQGIQGVAGPVGATGVAGPVGATGVTGAAGTNGTNGAVGATGAQGPIGLTGIAGATGAIGPQGPIGATGATGALGPIGPQGAAGQTIIAGQAVLNGTTDPAAATGIDGEFYINTSTNVLWGPKTAGAWPVSGVSMIGPVGAAGATGAQGLTGTQGLQGIQGVAGAVGPTGATGPIGATGLTGAAGINGTNGAVGATGPQGVIGLTGAAGAIGAQGIQGLVGAAGAVGAQGIQGVIGLTGSTGAAGSQGPIGLTGANGTNGTDGKTVLNGAGTPIATAAAGAVGDFYIDTTNSKIYGPKTSATDWTGITGVSLVGLQGTAGTNGTNGTNGAPGTAGANGTNGAPGAPGATGASPFALNGSDAYYTAGNVGIGTTTPGALLSFGGNANAQLLHMYAGKAGDPDANSRYGFGISVSEMRTFAPDDGILTFGNIATSDGTTYTEKMRMTGAGNFAIGTATPAASALLEVASTTKGFLPPRMTTAERGAIGSPATGLTVYDTDLKDILFYNGTAWVTPGTSAASGVTNVGGTLPIVVANGTSTPSISIAKATGTVDGYLAAGDFSSFATAAGYGNHATAGYMKADGTVSATGSVNMGGNKITNLASPTAVGDAATKSYVDSLTGGLVWKDSVVNLSATAPVGASVGVRYIATADWSANAINDIMTLASTAPDVWTNAAPSNKDAVFASAPANGYVFNGSAWVQFNSGATYTFSSGLTNSANTITLAPNGVATGNIADGAVTAAKLNVMGAASGQILKYNGAAWAPATLAGGGTVTSVGATAPLANTGTATDPVIALTGTIADSSLNTISTAGKVANSATTATASNSGSTIVARDASGNFSAGTITANLTGNVTGNATTATTAGTVTTNANLTGQVTSVGNAATVTNAAVIGKVLTGYVSGAGTVAATDTVLQAINKLNGNIVAGTNATHTGDATGATALSVKGINGQLLSSLATGILKNTTTTGVPSIAVAGTDYMTPTGSAASLTGFPTLNQNTTGNATTATTATNLSGGSLGTIPYQSASGTTVQLAAGTSGYLLKSNGAAAPSWTAAPAGTVTSVTGTAPISVATGTTTPSISLGTVGVANGGTGATTLTGVLHGNGTSTVTAANVALASEVSGTLPVGNGGTGATTLTSGQLLIGNGTSAVYGSSNLIWDNTNSKLGVGISAFDGFSAALTAAGTKYNDASVNYQMVVRDSVTAYSATPIAGILFQGKLNIGGAQTGLGGITVGKINATSGDSGSYLAFHSRPTGTGATAITERMRIADNGYVGIGTTTPSVPLQISGGANTGSINTYTYYAKGDPQLAGYNSANAIIGNTSIWASGRVVASEFDATSDARIKEVNAQGATQVALEKVNRLKITDYRYLDKVEKGTRLRTGVLAQEAEQVFPDAVHTTKDFIPNLMVVSDSAQYDAAEKELTITLPKSHDLKVGDRVRYAGDKGRYEKKVVAVTGTATFTLAEVDMAETKVFVIGKEVDDFRVVNYEDLFSNGLAAIQELSKQNDALKKENSDLKTRLKKVEKALGL